jgi:hypothetical protein
MSFEGLVFLICAASRPASHENLSAINEALLP